MTPSSTAAQQFSQLFELHSRASRSHIAVLVVNRHDAEELFQETSATLWQKFQYYQSGTDFRAWACRVAYYKVLKHRASRVRKPTLFGNTLLDVIDEEMIAMSDALDVRSAALVRCREKLPRGDRSLLDRYYDKSVAVVALAESLKCSTQKVYRELRRIHETLHACVTRRLREESSV
jgi:RNA polymerase sigma-70 factor (ECF subfamily)